MDNQPTPIDLSHMTNWDKWQLINVNSPAPDSFINFGFYYMIAAALQRRVWLGSENKPLFPNIYVMLVGRAGIGKGIVIKPVSKILKHHRKSAIRQQEEQQANREKTELEKAVDELQGSILDTTIKAKKREADDMLIPIAPDATTYEALCASLAGAFRAINYVKPDGKKGVYGHSSLAFTSEEAGALFRKKTEDVVNLLLQAYDCGDYSKETKTQGNDYIKRCCLNFLAGTTPDFMQQIFNDDLINQGFSSRTFFIFAINNRKYVWQTGEETEEQKQCEKDLIAHVLSLSKLYGQMSFSPEADAYLKQWWEREQVDNLVSWRKNASNKLDAYYARKDNHMKKMCMIIHCSELKVDHTNLAATDMVIKLDTVLRTKLVLEEAEANMHYALQLSSNNPLAPVTRKVIKHLEGLKQSGADLVDLLREFWDDLPTGEMDLRTILTYLIGVGTVVEDVEDQGKKIYRVKRFSKNKPEKEPS